MAATHIATPIYDRVKDVKEFDESKMGVKGLVDSGITSIPNMFIHPPETLSTLKKPTSQTCTKKSIPLITTPTCGKKSEMPLPHGASSKSSTMGYLCQS
ncbi:hypothetical protein SO802_025228 [Lithocarpus litseifolius]|uniref:Uncharacterized protein n=1 Tax=Lithocarpus litseifolius TaxID=425828 RepID=A0AAW2BYA4_9ROSI